MRRSTLTGLIALLVALAVGVTAGDAIAKKKGKAKGKKADSGQPPEATEPPQSEAIAAQLGQLEWGMSPEQVLEIVKEQVREEYKAEAAMINDTIKEDKLFLKMEKELKKIEDSYYEFKGGPKWDSSVVKTEYTHNNGEAMFVVKHKKWSDFYFFIASPDYNPSATSKDPLGEQNKVVLWKLYRAFDAAMFPGLDWQNVREILAKQFGPEPFKVKEFDPDTKFVNVVSVQWQDQKTMLSLVNQFTFFGIFCLRFEDKHIAGQIDKLRVNKPAITTGNKAIVDGLSDGSGKDSESNIVDILTGEGHGAANSSVQ